MSCSAFLYLIAIRSRRSSACNADVTEKSDTLFAGGVIQKNLTDRRHTSRRQRHVSVKGKIKFPHTRYRAFSLDPDVQAVSPQVTLSHPRGGRLPVLSTGPTITFPAEERHCPSAGTKLYCLVTEAHVCEQLAKAVTCRSGPAEIANERSS